MYLESLMKLCELLETVEIYAWTKVARIVHICANTLVNIGCSVVNESRKLWTKRPHVHNNHVN